MPTIKYFQFSQTYQLCIADERDLWTVSRPNPAFHRRLGWPPRLSTPARLLPLVVVFLQRLPPEKTFLTSSPLLFAGCGASMDPSRLYGSLQVMLFVLATGFALSATFLSDGVIASNGPAGRSLLQAKTPCAVSFEFANYTVLTSQCKGPTYPATLCCKAFKEFACPYAERINDPSTNCAETMFNYMNLRGNYPPGLFANICKEGKDGLDCTGFVTNSSSAQSGNRVGRRRLPLAAVIVPVVSVPLLFL